MTLKATIDTKKNPPEITVVSDKRRRPIKLIIESAGETATATGEFAPHSIVVKDEAGKDITASFPVKSDDGATAVLTFG